MLLFINLKMNGTMVVHISSEKDMRYCPIDICPPRRKNNVLSVFVRSMAPEKVSNGSRIGWVDAPGRLLYTDTPPKKWLRPKRISKWSTFTTRMEKVLIFSTFRDPSARIPPPPPGGGPLFEWGSDQRGSFSTSTEPILDFLDTKSNATDALDTNLALFLRHPVE